MSRGSINSSIVLAWRRFRDVTVLCSEWFSRPVHFIWKAICFLDCSLFAGLSLKCEWGKHVYHFDIWALWQYEVFPLQYLLICLIPLCSL